MENFVLSFCYVLSLAYPLLIGDKIGKFQHSTSRYISISIFKMGSYEDGDIIIGTFWTSYNMSFGLGITNQHKFVNK
jgi:hypothetical protein